MKRMFCDKWKLYEIQILMTIDKILLENSHTHLLMYCLWLPSHYNSRAWCGRHDVSVNPCVKIPLDIFYGNEI